MKKFCARHSTARSSAGGTTIQPSRQPVIEKYFEKLLTTMASSLDGERRRRRDAAIGQAVIDLVGNEADAGGAAIAASAASSAGDSIVPVGLAGLAMISPSIGSRQLRTRSTVA